MGLADSPHFVRFVHAMASHPKADIRFWVAASGVPQSPAYRIARCFRFHGANTPDEVDVRRTLRLAADLRRDRAMPEWSLRFENPQDALTKIPKDRFQLAFSSAANKLGFFEPEELHIRMDHQHERTVKALKTHSVGPSRGSPIHIHMEHLDRFPPPFEMDGDTITDPLITLMDLYSHPRAGAHAEFLDGVLVEAGFLPERKR